LDQTRANGHSFGHSEDILISGETGKVQ